MNLIPETGYLRLKQIIGNSKSSPPTLPLIPVGKSTWWKGVKEGRFPKGVKISQRVTAWRVEDIRELAKQAGIELLAEDKKWLQSLGYFCLSAELLDRYIQCWIDAMNNEKIEFKKQNKGRFAANTFIRESIKNDN